MRERLAQGRGKTVLNGFQAALVVLETTGRVQEGTLSRDKTWSAQLAAITEELERDQPGVRQAPMLTVAAVVALKIFTTMASEPAYESSQPYLTEAVLSAARAVSVLQGPQT